MSACVSCGAALRQGAKFCATCGAPQARQSSCVACGAELVPGARFCDECGTATTHGEEPGPDRAPATISRRVTSVLFGDLVGFTSLSEARDQEEVRELLSRYFEECRRVVARYGGTIEKFIGDAVMAVWGVPVAHEDDAERAVRAGLELVSAVAGIREEVGVPDLDMRVGIVTGEVAVTVGATNQGMVAGDAVNTASRVQGAAMPGHVWVDETTRLLTSSSITYADAGAHALKGKAEPVPLWAVRAVVAAVGGAQRADGLEAPLVGRDRELRLVKELYHRAEESRRQALLVISGGPGTGKSRLAWEFEKYVDGLSTTARWHSGRCVSYGEGVAFYAFAEAIRGRIEAGRTDDAQPFTDRLDEALAELVGDEEERTWIRPRLEVLLGIAAGEGFAREDLFAAWTAFLRALSHDGDPVVLVVEDAQHADEGLVAFLEHLSTSAAFPCFVILIARPELLADHPQLGTNRRTTVIHLEELSAEDLAEVLDGLVSGLPASVRTALVARSEGVPLFAVEIVRSLIDRDLVLPRGGQYVLADPERLDLEAIGAPTSLQTLVAARLDALTPELRHVVCRASVLGTSFHPRLLDALCPGVELPDALASLVKLQILRQEASRLSAERGQYVFVQTVVRQVAYGTLSRRDRRAVHLVVAEQLEATASSAEVAPVIAQHYLEAVRAAPDHADNPSLVRAAVTRLRQAAERARALGAPGEAAAHLLVAVDLIRDDVPLQAGVERDLASALMACGRYEDAIRHGQSAMAAFDELGDDVNAGLAAASVARAYGGGLAEVHKSLETARPRYQALLGREGADAALLALSSPLTYALERLPVGEHRGYMELDELLQLRAMLAERAGDREAESSAWLGLALRFQEMGSSRLCLVLLEAIVASSRETHNRHGLTMGLLNLNAFHNSSDAARAAELGREAIAVARTLGEVFAWESAVLNLVIALWCRGAWDEIDDVLEENREALEPVDPSVGHTRLWVAAARGLTYAPWGEPKSPGDLEDPQQRLWHRASDALLALAAGESESALAAALEAVEAARAFAGFSDDFFIVWLDAVHVARATARLDVLRDLHALAGSIPDTQVGPSMRAGRAYAAALIGIEDGLPDDAVEQSFRDAVDHGEGWGATLWVARFRVDHAAWLIARGRTDEARPLAEAARQFYTATGSTAWLAEVDGMLPPATTAFASAATP